jgi:hypothetical protein
MAAFAQALKEASPSHDKAMAVEFLSILDPGASKFTFQFFSDTGNGPAEVFHGSLDEVWPKVEALNTPARGMGAFVTPNETDGQGRRRENIVRVRALFADADLGTDEPVKDLPRVMRPPGTLHLKDPNNPRRVTLKTPSELRRWKLGELAEAFDLQVASGNTGAGSVTPQVTPQRGWHGVPTGSSAPLIQNSSDACSKPTGNTNAGELGT